MKILLVDKSRVMLSSLTRTLNNLGYMELEYALSGEAGLEKLQEFNTDIKLIIMEWNLPQMGGLGFVQHVRHSPWRDIPILMVTASADRSTINKAMQAGVDEYLAKPFTQASLKDLLELMC